MKSAHSQLRPEYPLSSMKKPFIDYKNTVLNTACANLLRKRFTRYIHKIQTEPNSRKHLFKTKHVKLVYSMCVPQAYQIQANKLLKVLKPLKSLANLSIGLEDPNRLQLTHFCYLKTLNYLKKLHLIFNGPEEAFLKYFAFPKKIQGLTLELKHFDLTRVLPEMKLGKYDFEGDPKFKSFYRQLDRLDNLHHLKLVFCLNSIPAVIGQFYESILKRMNCLKSLSYQQLPWTSNAEMTFNLSHFWKAITPSRNSLENLDIRVPHISPFSLEDISIEMPRLKTINIEVADQRFWADNIIKIWRECQLIKSQNILLSLNLRGIDIQNDKMLRVFLDGITDIEDSPNLALEIMVFKGTPALLATSLCRFLTQTNMQGSIYVKTTEKTLYSWENLKRIENAAEKNRTLRSFGLGGEAAVAHRWDLRFVEFLEVKKGKITKLNSPYVRLVYESEQKNKR